MVRNCCLTNMLGEVDCTTLSIYIGTQITRKNPTRFGNSSLMEATPGDLSLVLPYRHMVSIMEMLEALDKVAPGCCKPSYLLYGVEQNSTPTACRSAAIETQVRNLFALGTERYYPRFSTSFFCRVDCCKSNCRTRIKIKQYFQPVN